MKKGWFVGRRSETSGKKVKAPGFVTRL